MTTVPIRTEPERKLHDLAAERIKQQAQERLRQESIRKVLEERQRRQDSINKVWERRQRLNAMVPRAVPASVPALLPSPFGFPEFPVSPTGTILPIGDLPQPERVPQPRPQPVTAPGAIPTAQPQFTPPPPVFFAPPDLRGQDRGLFAPAALKEAVLRSEPTRAAIAAGKGIQRYVLNPFHQYFEKPFAEGLIGMLDPRGAIPIPEAPGTTVQSNLIDTRVRKFEEEMGRKPSFREFAAITEEVTPLPWGVRGAVEQLPLVLAPGAGQTQAGLLRAAGRTRFAGLAATERAAAAALTPVVAAERAAEEVIAAPFRAAGAAIAPSRRAVLRLIDIGARAIPRRAVRNVEEFDFLVRDADGTVSRMGVDATKQSDALLAQGEASGEIVRLSRGATRQEIDEGVARLHTARVAAPEEALLPPTPPSAGTEIGADFKPTPTDPLDAALQALDESRAILEAERVPGMRAPKFGTAARAEFDAERMQRGAAGQRVTTKAQRVREARDRVRAAETEAQRLEQEAIAPTVRSAPEVTPTREPAAVFPRPSRVEGIESRQVSQPLYHTSRRDELSSEEAVLKSLRELIRDDPRVASLAEDLREGREVIRWDHGYILGKGGRIKGRIDKTLGFVDLVEDVPLSRLVVGEATRAGVAVKTDRYIEMLGKTKPPLISVLGPRFAGDSYQITNGHHRVEAAKRAGRSTIRAWVTLVNSDGHALVIPRRWNQSGVQDPVGRFKKVATEESLVAPSTLVQPPQIGSIQAGMGIGERPSQGQLLGEFQGRAPRPVPLIDAEQVAAEQGRRAEIATGQAEFTPPPGRIPPLPGGVPSEIAQGLEDATKPFTQQVSEALRRIKEEEAGFFRLPRRGPSTAPIPRAADLMADLQGFDEAAAIAFKPDNFRRVANLPVLREIAGVLDPAAVANKPIQQAVVGHEILRSEGLGKAQGVMAHLWRRGTFQNVFGKLDKDGRFAEGTLRGLAPNDVRTWYKTLHRGKLTPEQVSYFQTMEEIEKAKLAFLQRNNIKVRELPFENGGVYAGRRIYGKFDSTGELIDLQFGPGPGRRPGAKTAQEKGRTFVTQEEAIQAGYRYLPEDEALYYNVMGAYNRVASQNMGEWIIANVPNRYVRGKVRAGEAFVQAPMFTRLVKTPADEFFPYRRVFTGPEAQENARYLNKYFNRREIQQLRTINQYNAVGRLVGLGGDASVFGIQLLLAASDRPKEYGKAFGAFWRAMVDPRFHADYIAQNDAVVKEARGLLVSLRGTEYTEALQKGGLLQHPALTPARLVLEPFQRAMDTAFDVAGVEMWKSMRRLATTPERQAMVEAFINESRGMASSARLGVTPAWRQAETLAMLAPRYNRAVTALLADLFHGNLRGQLARRQLLGGLTGIVASYIGVSLAIKAGQGKTFPEAWEEVEQRIKPVKETHKGEWIKNPDFLLFDVFGQRIGPGSKILSIIRLVGDLIATGKDDPEALVELADNPGLRWLRGQVSPLGHDLIDGLTGRTYMGEPVWDSVLSVTKNLIADGLMPIWARSVAMQGGPVEARTARGGSEFFGGRAIAESPFGRFARYTQEKEEIPYDLMSPARQKYYQNVDVKGRELYQAHKADQQRRGLQDELFEQFDRIDQMRRDKLKDAADKRRADRVSRLEFRNFIQLTGVESGAQYDMLAEIPRYQKMFAKIREMRPDDRPAHQIWQEYKAIIHDPVLDRGPEGFNFPERDRRLEEFRKAIGEARWKEVQEAVDMDRRNLDPLIQQYYRDMEFLRHYWELNDQATQMIRPELRGIWQQYLDERDEIKKGLMRKQNRLLGRIIASVEKEKERMRIQNPEIGVVLLRWGYISVPKTRAEAEEAGLMVP